MRGPLGAPGMPEWGQLPLPKKILAQGVRDMLRISDARMSGTSYGACVLHVAPESYVGGPLALVRTGDIIELDVAARSLNMKVGDAELARRRAAGSRVRRVTRAATARSMRSTSPRPTRAATSTSCTTARRRRIRKYTEALPVPGSHAGAGASPGRGTATGRVNVRSAPWLRRR